MYAITHKGKAYGPGGIIKRSPFRILDAKDADAYNQEVQRQELEWLKTHPEKLFLYVRKVDTTQESMDKFVNCGHDRDKLKPQDFASHRWEITNFLGMMVSEGPVWVGASSRVGFQSHYKGGSTRRPVSCTIFGQKYHGWYMESSGDYCRLKRAKR